MTLPRKSISKQSKTWFFSLLSTSTVSGQNTIGIYIILLTLIQLTDCKQKINGTISLVGNKNVGGGLFAKAVTVFFCAL